MSWNDLLAAYNHITVIVTRIGYGALVTMMTAELALASLLIMKHFAEKLGAYALLEKMGRVITMLYFVPAVFWVIQVYHQGKANGLTSGTSHTRGDTVFLCNGNMWLIALLFLLVWIEVAILRLRKMALQRRSEYMWLGKDYPAPLECSDLLETMRKDVGLRRPVSLRQRYGLGSPMTTGIISPKIIIPAGSYREEELMVIFAHELEHIRRKDVLFRLILDIAECVFWFCPLIRLLHPRMTKWSETCCDLRAGERIGSIRDYMSVVAALQPVAKKDVPGHAVCMADDEGIEERVMRVKRYQQGMKRKGRSVLLVMLSLMTVMCGGMTALAAGEGVAELSSAVYNSSRNSLGDSEEVADPRVNDGIEYTDNGPVSGDRVVIENPVQSYFSTYKTIAWIVSPDHVARTPYFTAYNGGYIEVVLKMEPEDKTVYVGIYTPSGSRRYVVVSGEVYHTFALNETGPYMVFVENPSYTTDVQVVGGYFYE